MQAASTRRSRPFPSITPPQAAAECSSSTITTKSLSRSETGSTVMTLDEDSLSLSLSPSSSTRSTRSNDDHHHHPQALHRLSPWFGLLAVAYMAPWTSLGALVSYFKTQYGAEFIVKLNCAYYLPGLPVALLQQWVDERLDARLGSATAYLGRVAGALVVAALALVALPAEGADASAEGVVLALVAALGAASFLAHGTATTLAAMFPPAATAWLQTGFRLPELYTLALFAAMNVGAHPDPAHLRLFLRLTAALALVGLLAWVRLVQHPATQALLDARYRGGEGGVCNAVIKADREQGRGQGGRPPLPPHQQ